MAYIDYRHCDVCKAKAFYDASLYDPENRDYDPYEGVGHMVVICKECAKTHTAALSLKEAEAVGDALDDDVSLLRTGLKIAKTTEKSLRQQLTAALAALAAPVSTQAEAREAGIPLLAIEALTNRRRQLDADGAFVGVSRQALDEVLSAFAAIYCTDGEAK